MGLWYYLKENLLNTAKNNYIAQPTGSRCYNKEEFIDKLLEKRNITSKTDIIAVLNATEEAIVQITEEGDTVNLGLFYTSFSITGKSSSRVAPLDFKDNEIIVLHIHPGKILKNAIKRIKVKFTKHPNNTPRIFDITDCTTGIINGIITSSGPLLIFGLTMKVGGDHPSNGVYMVNENNEAFKVPLILVNTNKKLIITLPTLPAGKYKIRITTQHINGTIVKEPRTGISTVILTIE